MPDSVFKSTFHTDVTQWGTDLLQLQSICSEGWVRLGVLPGNSGFEAGHADIFNTIIKGPLIIELRILKVNS